MVVAGDDKCAVPTVECCLKFFDDVHIEIVGGFVYDENPGFCAIANAICTRR